MFAQYCFDYTQYDEVDCYNSFTSIARYILEDISQCAQRVALKKKLDFEFKSIPGFMCTESDLPKQLLTTGP